MQVNFSGESEFRRRRLDLRLPAEAAMAVGNEYMLTGKSTDPVWVTLSDKLIDPGDVIDEHLWADSVGSLVVTGKVDRTVTLALDATLSPFDEATGGLRLQGTITIDFARQPTVEPGETQNGSGDA